MKVRNSNTKWLTKTRIVSALFILFVGLLGCRPIDPPPTVIPPFVGTEWEWTGTDYSRGSTLRVPDPSLYTILFQADGTYTGKADCNSISGTYTVRNDSLELRAGPSQLAACPPGSLDIQFTSQLEAVSSFESHTNVMTLTLARAQGDMRFRASTIVPPGNPTPIPVTVTPAAAQPTSVPSTNVPPTNVPPTGVPPTNAPPTNTPPPACAGLPQIEFFAAEPATIVRGQNSVLRWGPVHNATSAVIDQGIGGVPTPGTVVVSPTQTTTYIMTAIGCGGQVQASTTVVVNAPTAPPAPTNVPTQPPPPTQVPTQPPPPTAEPTQAPPTAQPGADILGRWAWTGTRLQDGSTVAPPNPGQYTIDFQPNGSAAIQADCNQASATWSVSGNQLSIVIGTKTTALCAEESLSERYLSWLGQANTYSVQGAVMTIDLAQDSGRMTLSR